MVARRLLRSLALVAAALLSATGPAGAQTGSYTTVTQAPYVKVLVDGQPVAFDVPPAIAGGRVLVPLRGVFERLGAVVAWDNRTQTVLAQRGATSVALTIGAAQAMINGQPAALDVPPMLIGGRTMVPLRFVSQALGANVVWDAPSATVAITTQAAKPAPPPPPAPSVVTGIALGVRAPGGPGSPGQIVVHSRNGDVTFTVLQTTAVSAFNAASGAGGSASLDTIRRGDQVEVSATPDGVARTIRASILEVAGRVAAVTNDVIVLKNGNAYRVNPAVQAVRGGRAVPVAQLQPDDAVTLRLNAGTNEVWGVTAQAAAQAPALTSVVASPSGRALAAGEVLTVVAEGAPGGAATFSIPGVQPNIAMREAQRGVYVGTYTVRPGDVLRGTRVIVNLRVGGRDYTAASQAPVEINAAMTLSQPPVITSPGNGVAVSSVPFTVRGRAAPNARVRVTADYAGQVLLFNVNGTLGTQTVTTNANGDWAATFTQQPPTYGLRLRITAVTVDANNHPVSGAATVTTTLGS